MYCSTGYSGVGKLFAPSLRRDAWWSDTENPKVPKHCFLIIVLIPSGIKQNYLLVLFVFWTYEYYL